MTESENLIVRSSRAMVREGGWKIIPVNISNTLLAGEKLVRGFAKIGRFSQTGSRFKRLLVSVLVIASLVPSDCLDDKDIAALSMYV